MTGCRVDERGARYELKDQVNPDHIRSLIYGIYKFYPKVHEVTLENFKQGCDMSWFPSYKNQF